MATQNTNGDKALSETEEFRGLTYADVVAKMIYSAKPMDFLTKKEQRIITIYLRGTKDDKTLRYH